MAYILPVNGIEPISPSVIKIIIISEIRTAGPGINNEKKESAQMKVPVRM